MPQRAGGASGAVWGLAVLAMLTAKSGSYEGAFSMNRSKYICKRHWMKWKGN